jgi:hypothetical protein
MGNTALDCSSSVPSGRNMPRCLCCNAYRSPPHSALLLISIPVDVLVIVLPVHTQKDNGGQVPGLCSECRGEEGLPVACSCVSAPEV